MKRARAARFGSVLGAVAVVAAIAVIVPLLHGGHGAGGAGGRQPGSSSSSSTHPAPAHPAPAAAELAQLTRHVPCPPPAQHTSRSQLRAFHAVAAVTCTYAERTFAGQGEWMVLSRQASGEVADLVAALDRPDKRVTSQICDLVLIASPPLALVDATGDYLVPRFPRDGCGQPQAAVLQAVQGHAWQTISTTRVEQVRSAQAVATNCDMAWKNEIHIGSRTGRHPGDPNGTVLSRNPDAALRVCIYRVSASDATVGTFVRGLRLDRGDSGRLRTALSGPAPSGTCHDQQLFAVVSTGAGDWVNVELGGCWRVLREVPDFSVGTAVATTVRRLLGLN